MCFNEQVNTDLTIWADTVQRRRHEGMTGCKKPWISCENKEKNKHHQTTVRHGNSPDTHYVATDREKNPKGQVLN